MAYPHLTPGRARLPLDPAGLLTLLLDIRGNVLLNVELLHCLGGRVNGILLHVLRLLVRVGGGRVCLWAGGGERAALAHNSCKGDGIHSFQHTHHVSILNYRLSFSHGKGIV